jgi:alkylation response protein AidB-like acyl-CoA dehydrogenase
VTASRKADGPAERLLAAVREKGPAIAARGGEIESARRLPPDLVEELRSIGLFRMLLPRRWGGLELDFPPSVDILAELSAHDGSTGWTTMIGCEAPQLLALLPEATFEAIYADGPDVIVGGAFAPRGTAVAIDGGAGGYRVSGRWSFASGCQHSRWLFGNCVVRGEAPAPEASPSPPILRCALLPAGAWRILDTWRTAGLRGTGSHDIEIDDAVVARDWTFDLFQGQPWLRDPLFAAPLLQFSTHIGAVALGIAEGALRDLIALAGTNKLRLYARASLADSPLFQYRLGHAEADLEAARALLRARAEELWARARGAGNVAPEMRTRVLQTTAWVAETATRVVDACYTAGGGSALYDTSPLQRRLRDIHALTQHASLQDSVFATAGAERLGRTGPFAV